MKSSTSTGQVLEPLAADQEDDREIEAAAAHQVDQRRGLALEALLAPVDHHAADGGIGLHRDFGILELAGPHDLEAGALDLCDDLIEPHPLQVVGIEDGCCEQKSKASEIVHVRPRTLARYGFGSFRDNQMTGEWTEVSPRSADPRLVNARFAMELGYHVTLVRDATAAFTHDMMHAAHDLNGPTYAHSILTTTEVMAALPTASRSREIVK